MATVTIPKILERVQKIPPEKLPVVYDFVSYLAERAEGRTGKRPESEAFQTMLASESVMKRDWDRPEEDQAWADL